MTHVGTVAFPAYSGLRCLMMPFVQGNPDSVPEKYAAYREIIGSTFLEKGDIGYLTIDESPVRRGAPHRGDRAKFGRALHTEAGLRPNNEYGWGGWGSSANVLLEPDVQVLLANSLDRSCAIWNAKHPATSYDGDIGDQADQYPYGQAILMMAGEVHCIGILTPHESLPVRANCRRQFLRIIGNGVHGREPYFTVNPLMAA
jgi:hypothetical protein